MTKGFTFTLFIYINKLVAILFIMLCFFSDEQCWLDDQSLYKGSATYTALWLGDGVDGSIPQNDRSVRGLAMQAC